MWNPGTVLNGFEITSSRAVSGLFMCQEVFGFNVVVSLKLNSKVVNQLTNICWT